MERLRYFNFIYRGATFRATLGLGFPEERLYVMEQDCTFGAARRDHTLGGAGRKRHCPGSHPTETLHRSRNNETPAARTLLGGCGRFQGGHTAASNDYTAGAPAGRRGMREFIALDTAEATTDSADSSAGTAGDRSPNHTRTAGGHTLLSAGTQRWSRRRRTSRRRTRRGPARGGGLGDTQ